MLHTDNQKWDWLSDMAKTNRTLYWWVFAALTFVFFVFLQVPAAWLIAKFYNNNHLLHNVSGNIWQGQADWKHGQLRGTLTWSSRPLDLILLRLAAQVQIKSGQTELNTKLAYGLGKTLYIQELNGDIAPDTLKLFAAWQWPNQALHLDNINVHYKKDAGFSVVEGQMHWQGGLLIYPFSDRQERIDIPALSAQLKQEKKQMIVDVRDQREQKMLNVTLDPQLMLDVQLTQRLLLNNSNYQGQASLESYVFSTRQPLIQGGV